VGAAVTQLNADINPLRIGLARLGDRCSGSNATRALVECRDCYSAQLTAVSTGLVAVADEMTALRAALLRLTDASREGWEHQVEGCQLVWQGERTHEFRDTPTCRTLTYMFQKTIDTERRRLGDEFSSFLRSRGLRV
jgi:hypothetical protein